VYNREYRAHELHRYLLAIVADADYVDWCCSRARCWEDALNGVVNCLFTPRESSTYSTSGLYSQRDVTLPLT